MAKAETNIPWVMSRKGVARVARHLGCTPEDAELRIVGKAKAGLIKARGVIEGWPISPLPTAWDGGTDLAGTTMRPPPLDASLSLIFSRRYSKGASYEITNLELCFIDLVAAGLLPAPAEKAWWLAEEAVAYLVKGVPLPWKEWMGAGATISEIEQAGIDLARAIGADQVRAQGRLSPQGQMESLPGSDLRIQGFVWVVRPDGELGTSSPDRLAVFKGRRWYGIEVDSATVRQALPKPLRVERQMLDEAEQLYVDGGSEPAARTDEPAPAVEPEPVSEGEPEPAALAPSTLEPSKPEKLPVWLETVNSRIAAKVRRKGPYDSLASLRKDIEELLEKKRKAVPQDRTIERGLSTHRPKWFINRGRKGDAS